MFSKFKYVVAFNHFTKKMTITRKGSSFDAMLYNDDVSHAFTVYDCKTWEEVISNIKGGVKQNYDIRDDVNDEWYYHPFYEKLDKELLK